MFWFRAFKNIKPALQEKINRQSAWLDHKKHLLADYLQNKSEKLSASQKKTGLFLFLLVGTAFCAHITYTAFLPEHNHEKLSLPKGELHNGSILRMGESFESVKTEMAIRNLIRFKNYMDSLQTTAKGKAIYDSILSGRPGMMDSINYIINNK